jgi:hypothetical protein
MEKGRARQRSRGSQTTTRIGAGTGDGERNGVHVAGRDGNGKSGPPITETSSPQVQARAESGGCAGGPVELELECWRSLSDCVLRLLEDGRRIRPPAPLVLPRYQ